LQDKNKKGILLLKILSFVFWLPRKKDVARGRLLAKFLIVLMIPASRNTGKIKAIDKVYGRTQ
jgi:hypothetical protein